MLQSTPKNNISQKPDLVEELKFALKGIFLEPKVRQGISKWVQPLP